jgi:hypothetical protein
MQRQALVDEGVVGRQQIQHAAVLVQDAVNEELGLAPERGAQPVVEVGKDHGVRIDVVDSADAQPLERKVGDERSGPGIGQQPADLSFEDRGVAEPAFLGHVEQRVVGYPTGDEEREARREIEVGDSVDGAGRDVFRKSFGAEQELRTGQNRGQPVPDGVVEIAGLACDPVERERRLEIAIGDRAAKRPARERGEHFRGTRELFAGGLRGLP